MEVKKLENQDAVNEWSWTVRRSELPVNLMKLIDSARHIRICVQDIFLLI